MSAGPVWLRDLSPPRSQTPGHRGRPHPECGLPARRALRGGERSRAWSQPSADPQVRTLWPQFTKEQNEAQDREGPGGHWGQVGSVCAIPRAMPEIFTGVSVLFSRTAGFKSKKLRAEMKRSCSPHRRGSRGPGTRGTLPRAPPPLPGQEPRGLRPETLVTSRLGRHQGEQRGGARGEGGLVWGREDVGECGKQLAVRPVPGGPLRRQLSQS